MASKSNGFLRRGYNCNHLQPPSSAEKIGEKSVNDDGKERSHNEYASTIQKNNTIIVIIISSASIELDNQQPSAQKNKR